MVYHSVGSSGHSGREQFDQYLHSGWLVFFQHSPVCTAAKPPGDYSREIKDSRSLHVEQVKIWEEHRDEANNI